MAAANNTKKKPANAQKKTNKPKPKKTQSENALIEKQMYDDLKRDLADAFLAEEEELNEDGFDFSDDPQFLEYLDSLSESEYSPFENENLGDMIRGAGNASMEMAADLGLIDDVDTGYNFVSELSDLVEGYEDEASVLITMFLDGMEKEWKEEQNDREYFRKQNQMNKRELVDSGWCMRIEPDVDHVGWHLQQYDLDTSTRRMRVPVDHKVMQTLIAMMEGAANDYFLTTMVSGPLISQPENLVRTAFEMMDDTDVRFVEMGMDCLEFLPQILDLLMDVDEPVVLMIRQVEFTKVDARLQNLELLLTNSFANEICNMNVIVTTTDDPLLTPEAREKGNEYFLNRISNMVEEVDYLTKLPPYGPDAAIRCLVSQAEEEGLEMAPKELARKFWCYYKAEDPFEIGEFVHMTKGSRIPIFISDVLTGYEVEVSPALEQGFQTLDQIESLDMLQRSYEQKNPRHASKRRRNMH